MKYLKNNRTGEEAVYKTELNYFIEGNDLVFEFVAHHCSFNSFSSKYNDTIYLGDVVELFLLKEKHKYYEIEVAPNGTIFYAFLETNDAEERKATYLDNNKNLIRAKTKKIGLDILEVNIRINYVELGLNPDNMLFNAYRIDTDKEKSDKHLFALYPTLCDSFHKEDKFGPF